MPLSDIVNVQITRETQTVSQAGFGTLMILGTHKAFNDRIRFYSDLTEVAQDFQSNSLEYIASRDVFAQNPRPPRLAIGRRDADVATIEVVTAMEGQSYTVTINGIAITLSDSTPTALESTVELDEDLVTSNEIDIEVNGNTLATIPFDTDHLTTMNNIANAIASEPDILSVTVGGNNDRTLFIESEPNKDGIVDSFVVTGGASQATATITNNTQEVSKATIADSLVDLINGEGQVDVTADQPVITEGIFNITADVSGTPFTLTTSTNITSTNEAKVRITQPLANRVYTVRINSAEINFTSSSDVQDASTIVTGLINAINDSTADVSATENPNNDETFFVTANNGNFIITVSEQIMSVAVGLNLEPLVASGSVTDDLDAIELANNDWYALAYTGRTPSTVESIANWVETRIKIFGTASSDSDIIDLQAGENSSIAAILNSSGLVRTFVMYHQDADFDFPEAAWFGRVLPTDPGSVTWKFKTLNSITFSELTTNQSKNARDKNANVYEFIGGVSITREGTMAQGEFIDIIRGVDWLQARIQEFVYQLLVNSPKVPYTNAGITAVEAEVRRALTLGVTNNFIADDPQFVVETPDVSDVSPTDKANRILRNVTFNATLAGAVHAVNIEGIISI